MIKYYVTRTRHEAIARSSIIKEILSDGGTSILGRSKSHVVFFLIKENVYYKLKASGS